MFALLLLSTVCLQADETDQRGAAQAWKGKSDRYTVIDFAAAWCRPCWDVLPRLQKYADAHPDVRVIVVSVDDAVKGRDALVEKLRLTIPVLWDSSDRIATHYKPAGMPATFILDPEGVVVYRHVGSGKKEWEEMIAFLEKHARR
jgi:cytochrome c biogenesis protein CcmG/thiol:disulfide interchange protein DsbE